MSSRQHIAYIIKNTNGTVRYDIFIKNRITSSSKNMIRKIIGENRLLKEKEQLKGESFKQFELRIIEVTKQIAQQLGLKYND